MTHDKKILQLLEGLSTNVSTILEEQQSQRIDIRSLQKDVSKINATMATKTDLDHVRNELKADIQDLRAEVTRILKVHDKRLANLEDNAGLTDPTKH